jgi:aminotransferase
MIEISKRANNIEPSLTRKLYNLATQYDDVIDFTLGDPDIVPHIKIREAGCSAIMQGKTRYSQNAGLLQLRKVISNYCLTNQNLKYDPLNEIIVTVGGMEGLYLAFLSIINSGDEVIIPAPYWINYKQMVQMCNGIPVIVNSNDDLTLSLENIKAAITDKTKIIVINTPNNPSGLVVSDDILEQLAKLIVENNLIVFTDEVYKTLIYDSHKFHSISKISGMKERSVIFDSISKQFSMTGWRLGYVMGPPEIIAAMTKLQENVAACAPLPSQYAAMEALSHAEEYSIDLRKEFSKRREILFDSLKTIPQLSVNKPCATFYAMINIKKTKMTSVDFAYKLLEKVHVAVVPGVTYGDCCEGYVRIAYTIKEDKIKEGFSRIKKFIDSLNIE